MSHRRSTYFISYASADVPERDLHSMVSLFERCSKDYPQSLIYTQLPTGADIKAFMAQLQSLSAVIILMTPSYKHQVLNRKGGVYYEFSIIVERLQRQDEIRDKGVDPSDRADYLEVLPVLFSGKEDESIPKELSHLKYADFREFRSKSIHKGRSPLTATMIKKYQAASTEMVATIHRAATLRGGSTHDENERLLSRLFRNTKANWSQLSVEEQRYLDTVFVKTSAYRRVDTQSALFLVGRKGSGKSTVTDMLALRNRDRYKGAITFNVDQLNLETCYMPYSDPKISSDSSNVFPRSSGFEFAWEAFLRICAIDLLVRLEDSHLTDHQKQYMPKLDSFIRELRGETVGGVVQKDTADTNTDSNRYFTYAFDRLVQFMDRCIAQARPTPEHFASDVQGSFALRPFLQFSIPREVLKVADDVFQLCRRRILITLDGFDTAFDGFRRRFDAPHERQARAGFEGDWLAGLLHLVLRIHQEAAKDPLFRLLDFCITIPYDRFSEIEARERDNYRYTSTFHWLNWSGIELAILLRKRLEELSGFRTNKHASAEDRLNEVLSAKFRQVPMDISFLFNGRSYKMPLFFYVLRHTMWRPRDVLMYYARILSVCEEMKKNGVPVTNLTIRRTVQDTTYTVINKEFLTEFETTILNIEKVVRSFDRQKQVISFAEIAEILKDVRFEVASPFSRVSSISEKVSFLYRVGFIGIKATPSTQDRLNLMGPYAFYFNEGSAPFRGAGATGLSELTYVIHPLFTHYLGLDTANLQELPLTVDWKYLRTLEGLLTDTVTSFMWHELRPSDVLEPLSI